MPSIGDQRLLWGAIVHVSISYTLQRAEERNGRPQQVYEKDDGRIIWQVIGRVGRDYAAQKTASENGGTKPDFQAVKSRALQLLTNQGLGAVKRNFYSSVVATFFSWRYHTTPERRREVLEVIGRLPPLPVNGRGNGS